MLPVIEEPGEVQQVERVGPHRRRRERPGLEVGQERVRRSRRPATRRQPIGTLNSLHRAKPSAPSQTDAPETDDEPRDPPGWWTLRQQPQAPIRRWPVNR